VISCFASGVQLGQDVPSIFFDSVPKLGVARCRPVGSPLFFDTLEVGLSWCACELTLSCCTLQQTSWLHDMMAALSQAALFHSFPPTRQERSLLWLRGTLP
jgi:hypothetical protein